MRASERRNTEYIKEEVVTVTAAPASISVVVKCLCSKCPERETILQTRCGVAVYLLMRASDKRNTEYIKEDPATVTAAPGSGFTVSGFGFRVWIQSLGIRVQGLGFRV